MPRIRPLRKQEDIDKVPVDQPVTLELAPEETPKPEHEFEQVAAKQKEDASRVIAPAAEAEEIDTLKAQLDDMRKAADESRKAAQDADRRRREEAKRRVESEKLVATYADRTTNAEFETILTAIAAAENEAESAARDYETATSNADFKAAAEANKRMAIAGGRLAQLETGKREV